MRNLMYRVINADGVEIRTGSYKVAKAPGTKILEVYLEQVDEHTDEQREQMREHARKVWEKMKAKRG